MQKPLLILLHLCLCFSLKKETPFELVFAGDYTHALTYLQRHHAEFKVSAAAYRNSPELLTTLVFPELIRYSMLSDVLETSALECLYTRYGSTAADFSIGRFQMKPSFVEQLEASVLASDSLRKKYAPVISYAAHSGTEQRRLRLQRLKTLKWQLTYLNAFVSVMQEKYKGLAFETTQDSLRFYAAAYNSGFTKSAQEIKQAESFCVFPYGTGYEGAQYAYCEVAVYFHTHVFLKKKSPNVPL